MHQPFGASAAAPHRRAPARGRERRGGIRARRGGSGAPRPWARWYGRERMLHRRRRQRISGLRCRRAACAPSACADWRARGVLVRRGGAFHLRGCRRPYDSGEGGPRHARLAHRTGDGQARRPGVVSGSAVFHAAGRQLPPVEHYFSRLDFIAQSNRVQDFRHRFLEGLVLDRYVEHESPTFRIRLRK
jgi:hypothetical protein